MDGYTTPSEESPKVRPCPDAPPRRPLEREESPSLPHELFEPAPRAPPAGDRLGRISPAHAAENAAFGAAILLHRPIARNARNARIVGRPHSGRNGGEGGYPLPLSEAAVAARAAVHQGTPPDAKKPRI